jgi:RNA polymerase sigma factor (sigma-70 family)
VACIIERLKKRLQKGRQRSPEDAEDLIQEAFLRLEEYPRKAEVTSEEAFMWITIKNLMINQHRRDALVTYVDEPVERLKDSLESSDPCADPERRLDGQQRVDRITRILEAGSRLTCEIYLAHRAGYTYREIAAAYGIRERAVEEHIATGVLLLMQAKAIPET